MKNKRTTGIFLLITGNLALLAAFSLNIYWSNHTLRERNVFPVIYDAILRAIYILAFLISLVGLRPIFRDYHIRQKKLSTLIFPIVLFLLPAFIFIAQVLQLGMILVK